MSECEDNHGLVNTLGTQSCPHRNLVSALTCRPFVAALLELLQASPNGHQMSPPKVIIGWLGNPFHTIVHSFI